MGYIEREAFLDAIERMKPCHQDADDIAEMLQNFPDADVRPVVRGKWKVDGHHIRCSICDEYMCIKDQEGIEIPREFCPNCGADMREES